MDNKKFFKDNEFDLFRIKYSNEPSEKLMDFLNNTIENRGVVFGFHFMTMLKSFTASGYEFVNFLDRYSEISRKFNEPFVRELKSILTGDLDDFAKIKRITEAKDRKDLKRVREGIVSNKNGEKTFEELYGSSIETEDEDNVNAAMFAHCFESIAKKGKRLKESNDPVYDNECKELLEVAGHAVLEYVNFLSTKCDMVVKTKSIEISNYKDTVKIDFSYNDKKCKNIYNAISYGLFNPYYKTIFKNKESSELLLDIELHNYMRDVEGGYDDSNQRDSINDHTIELHLTDRIDEEVNGPSNIQDLHDEINVLLDVIEKSKNKIS